MNYSSAKNLVIALIDESESTGEISNLHVSGPDDPAIRILSLMSRGDARARGMYWGKNWRVRVVLP